MPSRLAVRLRRADDDDARRRLRGRGGRQGRRAFRAEPPDLGLRAVELCGAACDLRVAGRGVLAEGHRARQGGQRGLVIEVRD